MDFCEFFGHWCSMVLNFACNLLAFKDASLSIANSSVSDTRPDIKNVKIASEKISGDLRNCSNGNQQGTYKFILA